MASEPDNKHVLPARRSARLRVSGGSTWDTALVIYQGDGRGADIETVFLENDFRCVRAGDEHEPAALVQQEKPRVVVLDPTDERFTGSGKSLLVRSMNSVGAAAIVIGSDRVMLAGLVPEVALHGAFTPKELRDAIKQAVALADARAEQGGEQGAASGDDDKRRRSRAMTKVSTARYAQPDAMTTSPPELVNVPSEKGPARPRRKRFNTTLSFKPRQVPTAPSGDGLLKRPPPRTITTTAAPDPAPHKGDRDWQSVTGPQATAGAHDTSHDEGGGRRRRGLPTREWPDKSARKLRRGTRPGSSAAGFLDNGTLIADRYVVAGVLGGGGMATVYRCHDRELDEEVALKLVDAKRGMDATLQRFRHEMRICRRLTHPNIVRTFEFGEWRSLRFITMELLDGRDLNELLLIAQGPLDEARGVRLMAQACLGLSAAHAVGVIHRDIKPHNLFVTEDGATLKIMDFGIAKTEDVSLTIPGSDRVLGTPAYLAPERLKENAELSSSTDIYSLGVVMYQVFTGRLPFMGPDISSLLTSIVLDDATPPSTTMPGFSKGLEATIMRAMARHPKDRHPACAAIADELRQLPSWNG